MGADYVSFIIEGLQPGELAVLLELSSIPKSRGRLFTEARLRKRKALKQHDIHLELRCLQSKGLARQVDPGKELWTLTREGKVVEHEIESRWIGRVIGFRVLKMLL